MVNTNTSSTHGTMAVVLTNHEELMRRFNLMESQAKKVVKRTVGDFKSRGPGWVSQEVCKEYNIKKKDVTAAKKGIKSQAGARRSLDTLSIEYKGNLLTPTHFQMKPGKRPANRRPYTVTAQFRREGDRKALGSKVFLAPSGGEGTKQIPFQRVGEERKPIKVIKTLSIPQMITNEVVAENIHERITEELDKRFEHNLNRIMNPSRN